jgi:hypothetical protein
MPGINAWQSHHIQVVTASADRLIRAAAGIDV